MPDLELHRHAASCANSKCQCRALLRNLLNWSVALPIAPGKHDETWLWYFMQPGKLVSWCCLLCHHGGISQSSSTTTRLTHNARSFRLVNFRRHAASCSHNQNVQRSVGVRVDEKKTALSANDFKDVFVRLRSGIASYSQHAHNSPGVLVIGASTYHSHGLDTW